MRISEIYTSFQGEGPRVGTPTIFLRFAGCNLKCPGWPCDTQHAIDPMLYRHEWKEWGPDQIHNVVMAEVWKTGAHNICFTGGEPFLQKHDDLRHLTNMLHAEGLTFEVFTNGTLAWPDWAIYTFRFVMDWKLSGSGEENDPLGVSMSNALRLTIKDAIKFTVKDKSDLTEAAQVWSRIIEAIGHEPPVPYCGPIWNGDASPAGIAEWILEHKLNWRLNIQTHKYIFGDERGI
jgi:7-carboxy-7-deazaguanine synthase